MLTSNDKALTKWDNHVPYVGMAQKKMVAICRKFSPGKIFAKCSCRVRSIAEQFPRFTYFHACLPVLISFNTQLSSSRVAGENLPGS